MLRLHVSPKSSVFENFTFFISTRNNTLGSMTFSLWRKKKSAYSSSAVPEVEYVSFHSVAPLRCELPGVLHMLSLTERLIPVSPKVNYQASSVGMTMNPQKIHCCYCKLRDKWMGLHWRLHDPLSAWCSGGTKNSATDFSKSFHFIQHSQLVSVMIYLSVRRHQLHYLSQSLAYCIWEHRA